MFMRSVCVPRGRWPDVILVFGSINIDLVIAAPRLPAPGETVIGESYRLTPGGKGANQALAAKRAGARVVLVGAVGTDAFAEAALALLRADGVELALLESAERPTGCAAITVAGSGENMITVAAGANRLARAAMVPDELLGPETTLLLQMEVPPQEVALLAERAKRRGCCVILNLAPATPPTEALLRQLDVLVVNEAEAKSLDRAPAALAGAFGLVVVETRGARGAVAFLPQGGEIACRHSPSSPSIRRAPAIASSVYSPPGSARVSLSPQRCTAPASPPPSPAAFPAPSRACQRAARSMRWRHRCGEQFQTIPSPLEGEG
jgi:ribokinase